MKLFVDNLTHLDFSYLDQDRGLLGETWQVNVVLEGKPDDQGMLWDFGLVKKTLKAWMDKHLDHVLLVPEKAGWLNCRKQEKTVRLQASTEAGRITLTSPECAVSVLPFETISAKPVAEWASEEVITALPSTITSCKFRFKTEDIRGCHYHYSHGLKHHTGNCQRIAHGHRSGIKVVSSGGRNETLEKRIASYLHDSYLGARADVIDMSADSTSFAYRSAQGFFALTVPTKIVRLLDSDTTVENIAVWLTQYIRDYTAVTGSKRVSIQDEIEIHAYEGIGKGAIAKV